MFLYFHPERQRRVYRFFIRLRRIQNDTMTSNKTCAIIAAAGQGLRMRDVSFSRAAGPGKTFLPLLHKPLISWTVGVFEECASVDEIILVLNRADLAAGMSLREVEGWRKVRDIIPGGSRRQDSVLAALKILTDCQWVVVHDGARPCLTCGLIEEGLRAASKTGAALAAVPVKDTIKVSDSRGKVKQTLPRKHLWAAQTPQVFRYDIILKAYRSDEDVTDDSSLVEKMGIPVKIYSGSCDNIKVTTPQDLKLAEIILKSRQ